MRASTGCASNTERYQPRSRGFVDTISWRARKSPQPSWFSCLVAAVIFGLPTIASAGPLGGDFLSKVESRLLRREATKLDGHAFLVQEEAPKKTEYSLSLGAAHTDGEDGSKTWATPFGLYAALPNGRTVLKLESDGYTRVRTDGETATGLSSIGVGALHAFALNAGAQALLLGAGVSVPTGGEVGGDSASQYLLVGVNLPIGRQWTLALVGQGIHSNASPPDGVSRFVVAGLAQGTYAVGDTTDLVFSVDRARRGGAGGQRDRKSVV